MRHSALGKNRCLLVERFLPAKDSVRWEIEIRGEGGPWTTEITTRLKYADAKDRLFWTVWSDPEQRAGSWRDPLVLQPFADRVWSYNGGPSEANLVVVPLATVAEATADSGLSLVLSPEDALLDLRLTTTAAGSMSWTRSKYRIAADKPLRFAMDLVAHEADWRGGLAWMVARYPEFFNPPNPQASVIFEVWIDGHRAVQTPVLRIGEFAYLDVNIPPGSNAIRLVAGDADDGIDADHADWGNAGFLSTAQR